jgi:putative transposase
VPRDHWLLDEEKRAIIGFHDKFPLEGYRRLTFMMIDQNVVAASPSSVYRVLSGAGLLDRWNKKPSKKGTGFVQPLRAHEHWHIDVSYLNLGGTFYYLCSILDGASRAIVHWEIREQMTETDVECILVRAHEAHPNERPRIISDNGVQRDAVEPLHAVADPVAAELEAALAMRRTGADAKALRRALRWIEELLDE